MSITVATYIGFVVAILILTWGAIAIGRRYSGGRRKIHTQAMNTWVPLKPTSSNAAKDPFSQAQDALEEDLSQDLHTRAQQNGHYSESKKNL